MKKFLSMILSIAIILTMAVPAFATNNAESEVSITPLTDNSWLETSINNSTMKTAATEQNAQSFVVKQYVDGKLWHASSGVVGGENIIAVSYQDGVAVKEETIKVDASRGGICILY